MFISCKCLNVLIEILCDNNLIYNEIVGEKLNFFNKLLDDKHSKKIFTNYDENVKVKFEIDALIQINHTTSKSEERDEKKWLLFQCLNCDCVTHGICEEKKIIVMDGSLEINEEEIMNRKSLQQFSPIFNILVFNLQQTMTGLVSARNNTITSKLTALRERYEKCILQEMKNTENRISEFREKQSQQFSDLKNRGEQELNTLIGLINYAPDEYTNNLNTNVSPKITHLDTPPTTPDSAPIESSPPFKQQKTTWPSPLSQNKSQQFGSLLSARTKKLNNENRQSSDADCLFDLEGLESDDELNSTMDDQTMDDNEEEEAENIVNPMRQYTKQVSINLAKSLPISMPIMGGRNSEIEVDIEDKSEDNVDIAASIKALAKSVHGDTVFGDLPRPRFSTQI